MSELIRKLKEQVEGLTRYGMQRIGWSKQYAVLPCNEGACLSRKEVLDLLTRAESQSDKLSDAFLPGGSYKKTAAEMEEEVNEEIARIQQGPSDGEMLDWLERHAVNVRVPLVYGSKDLFWATPDECDGEQTPSDLRAQIRAEMERKDV